MLIPIKKIILEAASLPKPSNLKFGAGLVGGGTAVGVGLKELNDNYSKPKLEDEFHGVSKLFSREN